MNRRSFLTFVSIAPVAAVVPVVAVAKSDAGGGFIVPPDFAAMFKESLARVKESGGRWVYNRDAIRQLESQI